MKMSDASGNRLWSDTSALREASGIERSRSSACPHHFAPRQAQHLRVKSLVEIEIRREGRGGRFAQCVHLPLNGLEGMHVMFVPYALRRQPCGRAFEQAPHFDAIPHVVEREPADDEAARWIRLEQSLVRKTLERQPSGVRDTPRRPVSGASDTRGRAQIRPSESIRAAAIRRERSANRSRPRCRSDVEILAFSHVLSLSRMPVNAALDGADRAGESTRRRCVNAGRRIRMPQS